jgi:Icc-related predicted phosphoesterase
MKIYAISDLHLEFYRSIEQVLNKMCTLLQPADVLILAGDVGFPQERIGIENNYSGILTEFLLYVKKIYKHVILVPGNHEYYPCENYNMKECFDNLSKICQKTDVILLEKSTVVIDGVEFIGTTLWSAIESQAVAVLADFRHVFRNKVDYLVEFVKCYTWLKDTLEKPPLFPRVVITHHLPTARLIHQRFQGSAINTAFFTSILDSLSLRNVKLWVCGHTHEFSQVKYGDTTLVVNPVGYPEEDRSTTVSSQIFSV